MDNERTNGKNTEDCPHRIPGCRKKMRMALKDEGLRITGPRIAIIDVLTKTDDYLTAEQIFEQVRKSCPKVGIASVYRNINLLTDMGSLLRHDFGEGKSRYALSDAYSTSHSHTIYCQDCQKVIRYDDFSPEEEELLKKLEGDIESKYQFQIKRHSVVYYGICPECQNK